MPNQRPYYFTLAKIQYFLFTFRRRQNLNFPEVRKCLSLHNILQKIFQQAKCCIYYWTKLDYKTSYLFHHCSYRKNFKYFIHFMRLKICIKMCYFALSLYHTSKYDNLPVSKLEVRIANLLITFQFKSCLRENSETAGVWLRNTMQKKRLNRQRGSC
jgi:hypothetical protein